MREHATPAAFRAAVEARLRERARRLSAPAYIVRRHAALERLLMRLTKVAPDRWALKGGLALETRFGARARVSIDLDADHLHGAEAARADLQRAAIEDVRRFPSPQCLHDRGRLEGTGQDASGQRGC